MRKGATVGGYRPLTTSTTTTATTSSTTMTPTTTATTSWIEMIDATN